MQSVVLAPNQKYQYKFMNFDVYRAREIQKICIFVCMHGLVYTQVFSSSIC